MSEIMQPELAGVCADKLLAKRVRRAERKGIALQFTAEDHGMVADAMWLGSKDAVFDYIWAVELAAGAVRHSEGPVDE